MAIEQLYVDGMVANLSLAPAQKNMRLLQIVDADLGYTKPGTSFNADDIQNDDDEVDVEGRAPVSPESFHDAKRRIGFFKAKAKGRWIEDLDTVRQLVDPTSTVMAGMMATKARATDDRIIAALTEDAHEGEHGETTVTFPAAQVLAANFRDVLHAQEANVVAASGDLPLTFGKLIRAKTMLDVSEIDGARYFVANAKALEGLLASTPGTNSDYNTVRALVNGEVDTLLGFNFVRSERLLRPNAGQRRCFAIVKGAVQYKERPIKTARITERADRSYRPYAYYEVERGAARRYDTGVVAVDVAEV